MLAMLRATQIQYMDEAASGGAGRAGGASSRSSTRSGGAGGGVVLLSVLLPIALPLLGLGLCYWQASKEGLADMLKEMKKRRDRSTKRRGTKSGGGFRPRQKLSQDGKGGRSANS